MATPGPKTGRQVGPGDIAGGLPAALAIFMRHGCAPGRMENCSENSEKPLSNHENGSGQRGKAPAKHRRSHIVTSLSESTIRRVLGIAPGPNLSLLHLPLPYRVPWEWGHYNRVPFLFVRVCDGRPLRGLVQLPDVVDVLDIGFHILTPRRDVISRVPAPGQRFVNTGMDTLMDPIRQELQQSVCRSCLDRLVARGNGRPEVASGRLQTGVGSAFPGSVDSDQRHRQTVLIRLIRPGRDPNSSIRPAPFITA